MRGVCKAGRYWGIVDARPRDNWPGGTWRNVRHGRTHWLTALGRCYPHHRHGGAYHFAHVDRPTAGIEVLDLDRMGNGGADDVEPRTRRTRVGEHLAGLDHIIRCLPAIMEYRA